MCVLHRGALTTSCSRPLQQECFSRCGISMTWCSRTYKNTWFNCENLCFIKKLAGGGVTKSEKFYGIFSSSLWGSLRSFQWWQVTSYCGDTRVKGESWTSVGFEFWTNVYVWWRTGWVGVFVSPWGSVCMCVGGSVFPWETLWQRLSALYLSSMSMTHCSCYETAVLDNKQTSGTSFDRTKTRWETTVSPRH